MTTRLHSFHKLLPLYLPFLLFSVASSILLYIGILSLSRRIIPCYNGDPMACRQVLTHAKLSEAAAQMASYIWFISAQAAFYKIYSYSGVYSIYGRRSVGVGRLIFSLYCLSVTLFGFIAFVMLTWSFAVNSG